MANKNIALVPKKGIACIRSTGLSRGNGNCSPVPRKTPPETTPFVRPHQPVSIVVVVVVFVFLSPPTIAAARIFTPPLTLPRWKAPHRPSSRMGRPGVLPPITRGYKFRKPSVNACSTGQHSARLQHYRSTELTPLGLIGNLRKIPVFRAISALKHFVR